MLSESFIASIGAPTAGQKAGSAPTSLAGAGRDSSIFTFRWAPGPVYCTGNAKRSNTATHSLAVSRNHLFAAQAGKSVVQVYGLERMNQEATVPFPERVRSVVLVADGSVLAVGTEPGSVILWEIYSGRLVSVPDCHLQPVSCLASDTAGGLLLTGSADANIRVWSVDRLRQFSAGAAVSTTVTVGQDSLVHTLTAHKKPVVAISVGHAATASGQIAVSVGEDKMAVVWQISSGVRLRTYLLPDVPTGVVLDQLDRGFFVGYADGTVQLVGFYEPADPPRTNPADSISQSGPAEQLWSLPSERWVTPNESTGPAVSLAVSWDGSRLLTGHSSGQVGCWDIATGAFSTLVGLPGPVNCLVGLPPPEIGSDPSQAAAAGVLPAGVVGSAVIVKPRLDLNADFSTKEGARNGGVPSRYAISVQLSRPATLSSGPSADFWRAHRAYASGGVDEISSNDFVAASLAELAGWTDSEHANASGTSTAPRRTRAGQTDETGPARPAEPESSMSADFVGLDQPDDSQVAPAAAAAQLDSLRNQISRLEEREKLNLRQIELLNQRCESAVAAWHTVSARFEPAE